MRTLNSIKNVIVALLCNTTALVFNFVSQSIFISYLGIEYSGLNGVFTNIISMLSIVELGLGTIIIYHLYKPIAEGDKEYIKVLMNFYLKTYRIIACIIFFLGLTLMPFIPFFVDSKMINENIYIVYGLFLFEAVVSYLIAYKRSLIYANQKNRVVDLIHILYILILNGLQIFFLITFKNFVVYLIIKILCRILENVLINYFANRLYPYLKEKCTKSLDKNVKVEILRMVKGQLYHQIGGNIVLSTDSIIISSFLGLTTAGIYTNYTIISKAANTILSQVFNAMTASVGDLLVEKDSERAYKTYKKINLLNFYLFSLTSLGMYFCINLFIKLWLGNDFFILSSQWVLLFSFNYYLQGMRRTLQVFASAGGICFENRYVPIIEAIINLCVSLFLVQYFGLIGVVLGTISSAFVLYFYGFPKYIYTPIFKKSWRDYIVEFLKHIFILVIMFLANYFCINYLLMNVVSNIVALLTTAITCVLITTFIFFIFFHKTEEFVNYKTLFLSFLQKKGEGINNGTKD